MNRYYVTRPSRANSASWGGGGDEEAVIEAAAAPLIRYAVTVQKVPNDTPLHDWREKNDKNKPLVSAHAAQGDK